MKGDDYRFETILLAGLMLVAMIGIAAHCMGARDARADEVLSWEQPASLQPGWGAEGWLVSIDGEPIVMPALPPQSDDGSTRRELAVADQTPVQWCWDVEAVNSVGPTKSANGPLCRQGVCSYDLNANGILDLGDLGHQIRRIGSEGLSPLGTIIRGLRTLCPPS